MLLGLVWFVLVISGGEAVFSYPKEAREAKIGEFPWAALMLRLNSLLAAGSVVSRFYVVSSCPRLHMFSFIKAPEHLYSNVRVIAGSISKEPFEYQGSQIRWIYYWEEHPRCRTGGETGYWSYDISVIKVREQFIFNELVSPMPFIRDQKEMRKRVEDIVNNNRTCTFGGWGAHRYYSVDTSGKAEGRPTRYIPRESPSNSFVLNGTRVSCIACFPKIMRAIEMTVMSKRACDLKNKNIRFRHNHIYRRLPDPLDSLCVIGKGHDGDNWVMNRTGRPCINDHGGALVCQTPDGPLVIGHFSYSSFRCYIEWTDFPSVFTRYDWGLHAWVNKFYSPSMFDKHWVDPTFPESKMFCPGNIYAGHVPPD